jgi:hypothetical protein
MCPIVLHVLNQALWRGFLLSVAAFVRHHRSPEVSHHQNAAITLKPLILHRFAEVCFRLYQTHKAFHGCIDAVRLASSAVMLIRLS